MELLAKGEVKRSVSEMIRDTVDDLYGMFRETDAGAWQRVPQFDKLPEPEVDRLIGRLLSVSMKGRMATARDKDCEGASRRDWESFVSGGLTKKVVADAEKYYSEVIPHEAVVVYQSLIAHARGQLAFRLAAQTKATHDLLAQFDVVYQRAKRSRQGLQFEDVTWHLVLVREDQ